MNTNELRRLVEQKTETVRVLEELLEQEETLLVELERQLDAVEEGEQRVHRDAGHDSC